MFAETRDKGNSPSMTDAGVSQRRGGSELINTYNIVPINHHYWVAVCLGISPLCITGEMSGIYTFVKLW